MEFIKLKSYDSNFIKSKYSSFSINKEENSNLSIKDNEISNDNQSNGFNNENLNCDELESYYDNFYN